MEAAGGLARESGHQWQLKTCKAAAYLGEHNGRPRNLGDRPGDDYTEDEILFMLAMERFQRQANRPYPDCRDVLTVAKSLGYRKAEDVPHAPLEPG